MITEERHTTIPQKLEILLRDIASVCNGINTELSLMANVSSVLFWDLVDVNWCGFYIFSNGKLTLGPFHGNPACVELPLGKGVCWEAVDKRATIVVPDVHYFEEHIVCDTASRSELVVPLIMNEEIIGVLDIDSPRIDRFGRDEKQFFEEVGQIVVDAIIRLRSFSP